MTAPEWLKPGMYGALIGALAVGVAGFGWGGWVTSRTANDMATAMARKDVVTALVPVCLAMAEADPDRAEKLSEIRSASTYQKRDALMEAGWATMPGAETASRDIAEACLTSLQIDELPEPGENEADQG